MSRVDPSSIRNLAVGAWEATSSTRLQFYSFVVLFIIAYSVDLLVPWAIGYTLGVFVERGFTEESLRLASYGIWAYVGIRLVHNFCHHLGRYLQLSVAYLARFEMLETIFSRLLGFPLRWHVAHHSGENLSRLYRSAGAIETTVGTYIWQIIEGVIKIVFASIAIFALDFWVAINVAAMGLLTILIMTFFNRQVVKSIRANNTFMDGINRICMDYLYNVVTIKSLNLEKPSVDYLKSRRAEGYALNQRIIRFSELKWGSVGVGYSIVMGTSLLIYFHHHWGFQKAFDVAQVYVLLNYLDRIFQAIGSFTGYYSGIIEAATAFEDATVIEKEAQRNSSDSPSEMLPETWKSIDIQDLTFTYSEESGQGFSGFDISIRHGDKIALVGPSGSGKSTLLKIIGGLLVPEKSTVLVDGNASSLDGVARSSLIIPQEPEIFSETARYNLTMGEKFSTRELSFFISLCRLEEVMEKLPHGWDSALAKSGMNISVGEKQRLALARGLLRAAHRPILLLDEPTSSLDPMTEKQIFHALLHHFADRTVITACHRLALVPLFDRILFIKNGRIEEHGTFAQLLDKRAMFYQAWTDYENAVGSAEKSEAHL